MQQDKRLPSYSCLDILSLLSLQAMNVDLRDDESPVEKKEKLPRENPSYLFNSKKSDFRIGPKNQLEAESRGRCQDPAETAAECVRR